MNVFQIHELACFRPECVLGFQEVILFCYFYSVSTFLYQIQN